MQGDGPEKHPQAVAQPLVTKCFEHGMQYDPTQHTGCVICRRQVMSSKTPAGGGIGEIAARVPPQLRVWAMVAAGVITFGIVIVIVRATLSTPSTGSTATGGAAAEGSPEAALAKYIGAVHAAESALPLDEARSASSGLAAEMRAGTLDVSARRQKIESHKANLEKQRDAFAAIEAPEAASAYRSIMVDWYGTVIALVGVTLTQLRLHEDVQALLVRKREITNRDEAATLQSDFQAKQSEVATAMENGRSLDEDAKALSQRKRDEEARLIREHRLKIAPPGAAAR